jgi:hypothetical protein
MRAGLVVPLAARDLAQALFEIEVFAVFAPGPRGRSRRRALGCVVFFINRRLPGVSLARR